MDQDFRPPGLDLENMVTDIPDLQILEPPVTTNHSQSSFESLQCSHSRSPSGKGKLLLLDNSASDSESQVSLDNEDIKIPHSYKLAPMKEKYICYGMIYNVNTKILRHLRTSNLDFGPIIQGNMACSSLDRESFYHFILQFQSDMFILQDISFTRLAVLNETANKALLAIQAYSSCFVEVYAKTEYWDKLKQEVALVEKEAHPLVDIVIYGPSKLGDIIGKELSDLKLYLQPPFYLESWALYENPHVLTLEESQSSQQNVAKTHPEYSTEISDLEGLINQAPESFSQDSFQRKVAQVMKSLTRSKGLQQIQADAKIKTQLLQHQEEALDFIAQRETGSVSQEYSLWRLVKQESISFYEHRITGHRTTDKQSESGGGILADDMGLGKTLTFIAVILRTLETTNLLDNTLHGPGLICSRSTLVLVTSPLLMSGWRVEIESHCVGALHPIIYHGKNRPSDAVRLADSDLVLSTYHTVAAEMLDIESPLRRVFWFRIVLDEADIIRRMSTRLFKAATNLPAVNRWCLTGTPIQNSLKDLGSLVTFLRIDQLYNPGEFRKHIINPFMKGTSSGVENLRLLLDSICLRRTRSLLNLPNVVEETRSIDLSSAEKAHYAHFERSFEEAFKSQNNSNRKIAHNERDYFGFFQLQLQLRRLCNHGTFQKLNLENFKTLAFETREDLNSFVQPANSNCVYCNVEIDSLVDSDESIRNYITICGHLLCQDCLSDYQRNVQQDAGSRQCPECFRSLPSKYLINNALSNLTSTQYFKRDGISSKISALMEDIQANQDDGKSIIFSSWVKSLDLVGNFLEHRSLAYRRIDGSISVPQRSTILREFDQDSSTRILLMTTGTGAVGLNITVASHVYILEPQYNPTVEDQAVARVLRLGQRRHVKVLRYLVNDTVEVGMYSQQKKKSDIARAAWKRYENE